MNVALQPPAAGMAFDAAFRSVAEVAYIDSLVAYRRLRARDGLAGARVRTLSPAVALGVSDDSIEIVDRIAKERFDAALADIEPTALKLYAAVRSVADIGELAKPACHAFVNWAKMVLKTLTLEDADLIGGRVVGVVEFPTATETARRNFPWLDLLRDNPQAEFLRISSVDAEAFEEGAQTNADLVTRFRYQSWRSLTYHALRALWKMAPIFQGRGLFLCARDNPLLREACVSLGLEGYALRDILIPPVAPVEIEIGRAERLVTATSTVTEPFFQRWLAPKVAQRLEALYRPRAVTVAGQYVASHAAWMKALEPYRNASTKALLTNSPVSPHLMAMCDAAHRKGIPVVSFQHGHSREIADGPKPFTFAADENFADLMVVYNRREKLALEASPFCKAEIVVAGTPADYHRTGTYRRRDRGHAPIMYVSTALYAMHLQYPNGECSDADKARGEKSLVENVLARLPHRVSYKPYPESRFVDLDPVIGSVRCSANIRLHETGVDLRYLIADARILITSRATSTFGWCLMSRRPVIYIEWPTQHLLTAECRASAMGAVFFFDAAAPSFESALREFLSRPIEDIELEYETRRAARHAFIRDYFDALGHNAGPVAARHILDFVGRTTVTRDD